jgi:hypothetical protein
VLEFVLGAQLSDDGSHEDPREETFSRSANPGLQKYILYELDEG